ncbi:MAG TPA: lysylphosphatidylglycerol synthase transmembrane domain-containing protein, partial [Candidatus Synoicihabitans sp.]|nr:lysylphosphatidylglycerol synthase transmembrane domain-containing protein [Candidatus Synoicihabitans sp.]
MPLPSEMSLRPSRARAKRWRLGARVLVTAGLLAWLLHTIDWSAFRPALARVELSILVLVLLLRMSGVALSAFKWQRLLLVHHTRLRLLTLVRWYFSATFLSQFLPTTIGGDAYRVWCTIRAGATSSVAVAAIAIERITGLAALATLTAIAGATLFVTTGHSLAAGAGLASATLVVMGATAIWLASRADRFFPQHRWLDRFRAAAVAVAQDLRQQPREIAVAFSLSLIFHANRVLTVWLVLHALEATIPAAVATLAFGVSDLAAALPISLGGLGVTEVSFVFLAGSFGISTEHAFAAMLLLRLLVLP